MSRHDNLTDRLFIESTDKSDGGKGGSKRKKDIQLKDTILLFI